MTHKTPKNLTRRKFLTSLIGTTAGFTVLTPHISPAANIKHPTPSKRKKRTLRFAHISDIHIQPGHGAPEGTTAMLRHAQSLKDKPQLFITGGDNIMDSFQANEEKTRLQWNLFRQVIEKEREIPIKYCLGNHDVLGWDKKASNTTGQEKLWGKKWAVKQLNLPGRYYSFDGGKWHFIILDSIFPNEDKPNSYIGKLDDEQFSWLRQELENTNPQTPIVIISHIPIVSVAGIEFLKPNNNQLSIPGSNIHYDGPSIVGLLKQYPNVKLCLSGHLHLCDRTEYCGTTYICDGAVCGNWWKGDHHQCDEGYGIIDLYEDGTFDHQYVAYNWQPHK